MNLRNIGRNQSVIELNDGTTVLFSYNTPVAAHNPATGYIATGKKWSNTTSRHIKQWTYEPKIVDQSVLDNMIR